MPQPMEVLAGWVRDARARTLEIYADLSVDRQLGPRLATLNPPLWELGHVAWFMENWVLRHSRCQAPMRPDADALWDSMKVPHDTRWDLALPSWEQTQQYLRDVRDRVLDDLGSGTDEAYFVELSVHHEDMHIEAFTWTRQTLGYASPSAAGKGVVIGGGPLSGDVEVPASTFLLGAAGDEPFVFDNEKWSHPVHLDAFAIGRAAVTQAEFSAFVDDGGYLRRELWTDAGWAWRDSANAQHPVYWELRDRAWFRRHFDHWRPLEPNRPVIHVGYFEAEAYCTWAGRRLPSEAEWERAACGAEARSRFPWGDAEPSPDRANLDARVVDTVDVGACPSGDSPDGCRQMIGNIWEWCATDFLPYPGFVADPYEDYSLPWFGDHKVLRGGCYVTRGRLLRNTWRNFATPDRRDVFAGFRTCHLD